MSLPRKSSFQDIIEQARDLSSWKDPYYDDKQGIVAVFDCQDSEVATEWLKSVKASASKYCVLAWVYCAALFTFWEAEQDENVLVMFSRYAATYVLPLLGVIYLARCYYFDYSSVVASLRQYHVAVTTEGVRFDSGYTSTCIPFSCIQSVEQRSLLVPPSTKTGPVLQGVMLSWTRRDFEKTCCTAIFGVNEKLVLHWFRIEKKHQEEFVDLVMTMKEAHEFKDQEEEIVVDDHQGCATSPLLRKSNFQEIEQAHGLSWRDPYYDDKQGIVAVFDCEDSETAAESIRSMITSEVKKWFVICVLATLSETGIAKFYRHILYAILLLQVIALVRISFDPLQSRLREDHVAVTTEGVRLDSSYTRTCIPFSCIQSVEQTTSSNSSRTSPVIQSVLLSTLQDFEKTSTAVLDDNESSNFLLRIEKGQEFINLVMAMKEAR